MEALASTGLERPILPHRLDHLLAPSPLLRHRRLSFYSSYLLFPFLT